MPLDENIRLPPIFCFSMMSLTCIKRCVNIFLRHFTSYYITLELGDERIRASYGIEGPDKEKLCAA